MSKTLTIKAIPFTPTLLPKLEEISNYVKAKRLPLNKASLSYLISQLYMREDSLDGAINLMQILYKNYSLASKSGVNEKEVICLTFDGPELKKLFSDQELMTAKAKHLKPNK